MLKVISLFAGPGAGKSTTAAALFNLAKRKRLAAELVTEVAKDWTYERNLRLGDQLSVLAEQHWRLKRLEGTGVELVISDSPLPLGLVYLNQHRLVVAQEVIEKDFEDTKARAAAGDDGSENAHIYSLFHQLTNLTREKDCLTHDDRIEVVGSVVGSFSEELGVNPDDMARDREEDRIIAELEKLMGEADELQGIARANLPALYRGHQSGRRRAGR